MIDAMIARIPMQRRRLMWLREWGWKRWLLHKTYWAALHRWRRASGRKPHILDWRHECVVCRIEADGFHAHRDTLRPWRSL